MNEQTELAGTKPWHQSLTNRNAVAAIIANVASLFGVVVVVDELSAAIAIIGGLVVGLVTQIGVIFGRNRATQKIG